MVTTYAKYYIEHYYKIFLETTIFINDKRELECDIYIKHTDKTLLLHNTSFHTNSCKRGIISSQSLRYRRLITDNTKLQQQLDKLRIILNSRDYKNNVINEAFNKALQHTQHDILHQEKK